jgi:hypothetical protein
MTSTEWEARYQASDTPWDKGEPAPGLVDFLTAHPELPRGTVCVPGCGTGHDVRAWARAGFQAWGLDLAPSAIHRSETLTRDSSVGADFRLANFLEDSPFQQFDWVFEHTLFCAIEPSERDQYVEAVLRWLKTDGQFLAIHYLLPDDDGPPFGTTREEIYRRFERCFQLVKEWVPRSYPNRTGLELMFWWRRTESISGTSLTP